MAARPFDSADRGLPGVHRLTRPAAHRGPRHTLRRRLLVVAPGLHEMVRCAGGWLCDQVMAGWDVTVLTSPLADQRPLRILGTRAADLGSALTYPVRALRPQAVALGAELYASDHRVQWLVDATADTDLRFWSERWMAETADDPAVVRHRPTAAARAFKTEALAALAASGEPFRAVETFRRDAALHHSASA